MTSLVIALWAGEFLLETFLNRLNASTLSKELPRELADITPAETQKKANAYLRETMGFSFLRLIANFAFMIAFLLAGGFSWIDRLSRSLSLGAIPTGLAFLGLFGLIRYVAETPFSLYSTFRIEERYGFNKHTIKTWLADQVRGGLLAVILGGILLSAILKLLSSNPSTGWVWAWAFYVLFSVVLVFLAPVLLLPLFNRFDPVPQGELLDRVHAYIAKENFPLKGVFVMDGSKRSSRSNAFFTGFGKFRRLVLFDTLMARQTPREIAAVVAHEIGHFKLHHIPLMMGTQIGFSFALFWLASLGLGDATLCSAFGISDPSIHASLLCLALLAGPALGGVLPAGVREDGARGGGGREVKEEEEKRERERKALGERERERERETSCSFRGVFHFSFVFRYLSLSVFFRCKRQALGVFLSVRISLSRERTSNSYYQSFFLLYKKKKKRKKREKGASTFFCFYCCSSSCSFSCSSPPSPSPPPRPPPPPARP